MTQIVADAEMVKQIAAAGGPVNVVDAGGRVIAVCTPVKRSPYTREEVEAARRQCRETGGKPVAALLAKLKEQNP